MRDPKRINQILGYLALIWQEHPDLQLGELLDNACDFSLNHIDISYMEDSEVIDCLKVYLQEIKVVEG